MSYKLAFRFFLRIANQVTCLRLKSDTPVQSNSRYAHLRTQMYAACRKMWENLENAFLIATKLILSMCVISLHDVANVNKRFHILCSRSIDNFAHQSHWRFTARSPGKQRALHCILA